MKRSILLACAALLLAACASGADVADDGTTSADSTGLPALEDGGGEGEKSP